MQDPITYVLGSLTVSLITIMLSKSYYAKRGDRRKGYSELEKQVKELTDYVKEKVHTSKQIEDLESSFDRRLNSIQEQVSLISGFMKSLFDKGVK